MTLALPQPIAAYYAADATNSGISQCFTEDALVKDEGHTYHGRSAIAAWKAAASKKYQYTCEPLLHDRRDGVDLVTCRVSGNFPGSPVDLRFHFRLHEDKIASLEIVL